MIDSQVHPDRCYVGSGTNLHVRWNGHKSKLRNNKHHSPKLQAHYNKYGIDDLSFHIIETFNFISKEHLEEREDYYIKLLHPYLNSRKKAQNNAGFKMSKEACDKISKGNKGKPKSKEHRDSLKKAWETREYIPNLNFIGCWKGKKRPPRTKEHALKISNKNIGRIRPKEECDRISKTMTGSKQTLTHIENARIARWGK